MGNCHCFSTSSSVLESQSPSIEAVVPSTSPSNHTVEFKQPHPYQVEEKDIYKDCTFENTPSFTFENIHKKVKVLRLVDGDTMDIALEHEDTGKIYKHRVRLYGIDTPEKRPPKNDPYRELEIEASLRALRALELIVQDNNYILVAHFQGFDKYGRLLCTLYDKKGDNMNEWMVKNGYANEYYGKTKKKFEPKQ
jgi:endonuclease YncB( thermonuclease family)